MSAARWNLKQAWCNPVMDALVEKLKSNLKRTIPCEWFIVFAGSLHQTSVKAQDNQLWLEVGTRLILLWGLEMYFEGRELKSHAEPVLATELQEGVVYFAVNYVDEDMLIPVIETLVFVGNNLQPDDVGEAYFQDVGSYREGVPYGLDAHDGGAIDASASPATFYSGPENQLNHIFSYEHAMDELMRCSLRRKAAQT